MIRRILRVLVCALCIAVSGATVSNGGGTSTIVNVKYIHSLIEQEWGIKLPYNAELKNPSAAANMRYLLAAIDATNSRIGTTTSYRTSEYATGMAANVNTSVKAVRTLIKPTYHFTATTTSDTTEFNFTISASGAFYINWGDGTAVQKVIKPKTGAQTISHTYATAGAHDIRIGGRATGYPSVNNENSSISFSNNTNLAQISGSLGRIFRNVNNNKNDWSSVPTFFRTFSNCTNLSGEIPEILFDGVPWTRVHMFNSTFWNCKKLTGSIPEKLFAGISGAPRGNAFEGTFRGCSGLTGPIPENLFAGVSGAPTQSLFNGTFRGCSGLTGSIPENLFAGISKAPAPQVFRETFSGCKNLTGEIPAGLFSGISGAPANGMFLGVFSACSGLTGEIPSGLFAGISGAPAPQMYRNVFYQCSGLTGEIPSGLFGTFDGAPAEYMFNATFYECTSLTGEIPANLFAGISGAPAEYMFSSTFNRCVNITGIGGALFSGVHGVPAAGMYNGVFSTIRNLSGDIPLGLFGDLSGVPAAGMFTSAFPSPNSLTGPSARNPDGTPLYEVFPDATTEQVGGMYRGVTGLSDYADIPAAWK